MVWGGADALRRLAEIVKWPFERVAWAIERGLVWPLEKRTDGLSPSVRIAGVAVLALLAAGAGVAGLVLASGGGSGSADGGAVVRATPAPTPAPAAAATTKAAATNAAPVLQGAKPDFAAEAGGGVAKGSAESPAPGGSGGSTSTAGSTSEVARSAPSGDPAAAAASEKTAGPAAIKVAHQFAGAFVLYEIGRKSDNVRSVFNETASPQLTHALLRRPPRQPAGTPVPKAKVLNIVPGPHHGDTYTLSVSLLRVGVTSELRLDMQRDEKTGKWEVTDALG
ncbi:MAG TPA: hypothetical protein VG816_11320 [Solirubrobacterales bacterium]|nr:hypothetical protein [Solirubrobacterales bacterium]